MSEFIRVSCVRSSINIISGIPELTIELSRIGKNFNQIVRAVYLHPQSLEASELARIADDLDAIKDLITELKEEYDPCRSLRSIPVSDQSGESCNTFRGDTVPEELIRYKRL